MDKPRFDTGFGRAITFFLIFFSVGTCRFMEGIYWGIYIDSGFLRFSPLVFLAKALDEQTNAMCTIGRILG